MSRKMTKVSHVNIDNHSTLDVDTSDGDFDISHMNIDNRSHSKFGLKPAKRSALRFWIPTAVSVLALFWAVYDSVFGTATLQNWLGL